MIRWPKTHDGFLRYLSGNYFPFALLVSAARTIKEANVCLLVGVVDLKCRQIRNSETQNKSLNHSVILGGP